MSHLSQEMTFCALHNHKSFHFNGVEQRARLHACSTAATSKIRGQISLKQSTVADIDAACRQNLGLGGVGRDFNVLTS